jgi:tryptophanyl-tRNA synthetase
MPQPTIFSGVQPSGNLHIGNYLGAIRQWVDMQDGNNCIFCVVDYHAITVKQDPAALKQKILEITKLYLASGINPAKSAIFQQSAISAHTELAWILNCVAARISDLNKMTQFKDKAGGKKESVSVGLYDYPVLMAADILLYQTDVVPVGEDQKQHVELARDLAKRFNNRFGYTFKVPEARIKKESARVMGLDDPAKKMSKSAASEQNYIALADAPDKAAKKIMRAVTDSGADIVYDKNNKPAIANLLAIYSLLSGKSIKDLEREFAGAGYGDFKKALAEVVREFLVVFQEKYQNITDKEAENVLANGAEKVRPVAEKTLNAVKERIGAN